MNRRIILRAIRNSDCSIISEAFQEQGWNKSVSQYIQYFEHQEKGDRDVIIAELNNDFAGYLTILWKSNYSPFLKLGIPEIVDFNVLKKYQRLGVGTQLMDEAENRIKKISNYAGIGFGVTQDYGAAQILYSKRNYTPDGKGLVKDSIPIKHGDSILIGDDIAFYLTKNLELKAL